MDNLNGIEVLKKIKRFNPNTIIVFISGQEDIDIAVNALKYGAFDYIMKSQLNEEKMRQVMTKAGQLRELLIRKSRKGILKRVFSGLGL
jgi:DNA-binding NtrC family response regulator